jgi:hypothetical protein
MAIERTEKKVDFFEKQQVIISTILAGAEIDPGHPLSFDAYLANMRAHKFPQVAECKRETSNPEHSRISTGGLIGEFVLDLLPSPSPRLFTACFGVQSRAA